MREEIANTIRFYSKNLYMIDIYYIYIGKNADVFTKSFCDGREKNVKQASSSQMMERDPALYFPTNWAFK